MEFSMTLFWLVLAVVMGVVEAITVQMVSIWFAIGAVASCITSLFVDNVPVEIAVFLVVSGIALAATRPLAKKLKEKNNEATNSDKYIGMTGLVTKAIDNEHATGQVRVGSSIWSATSANDKVIEEGARVVVNEIKGVKLIVEEIRTVSEED